MSKYAQNQPAVILWDALIQRFEHSTEAFWKYLKAFLQSEHNLSANSPREVIRTGLVAQLYSKETSQELLQMLDGRNLTNHTYVEDMAGNLRRAVGFRNLSVHLHPVFENLGHKIGDFPVAEKVANLCLSLPMSSYLSEKSQTKVIVAVSSI